MNDFSQVPAAAVKPRLLIGGMTENPGGKESFMLSVFYALRDDFECWFLVDRVIHHEAELLAAGAKIARITPRGASLLAYLRDLSRLFRETKFAAVWMNQTVVNSLEPLWFARRTGVPIRALHSHSSRNMGGRFTGMLHYAQRPFVRFLVSHRLACSAPAGQWFFGRQPYVFVPNLFDVDSFSYNPETRNAVRAEHQLPASTLVLAHVASFSPVKNHRFSLAILDELVSGGADVKMLFVGDGSLRSEIEADARSRGLADHVRFLGLRSDVKRILQAADALLLPSFFEGLPFTALEAQAAGLPTFLSDRVTREAGMSTLAYFLPLKDGAHAWAREILDATGSAERGRQENPLEGTPFDARLGRQTLRSILYDA